MQVKICGLRTRLDVAMINKLHPDYAGFVFAAGRHQVKLAQVQTLRAQLAPGIKSVGVFVNAAPALVAAQSKLVGLDVIQLHGDEDAAYIRKLRRLVQLPVLKAIRLGGASVVPKSGGTETTPKPGPGSSGPVTSKMLQELSAAGVQGFLFDTASSTSYGGTGQSFNLELLEQLAVPLPFFVAGGLTALNVQQVICRIRQGPNGPLFKGVDVSSAVETDGHKDYEKAAAFLSAVRSAAAG